MKNSLVNSLKKSMADFKKDVPMRVTEYSKDEKGNVIRKVSMKRPSELK